MGYNIELQDVGTNNHFAQQIISNEFAGERVEEKKGRSLDFKSKKHKAGEKGNAAKGKGKGEDYQWSAVVSVLTSEAAKKAAVAAAKEVCKAAVGADCSDDPDEKEDKKSSYTKQEKKTLRRM